MKTNSKSSLFLGVIILLTFASCARAETKTPDSQPAKSLIFYDWEGDMPEEVLDAFEAETGIVVEYRGYEDQESVLDELRQGEVFDVVVMETRYIPFLIRDQLITPINFQNIPNFRNISPNFRDLQHDPGNVFSVPFNYGTTGLLVRTDLVNQPVAKWADLWDPQYRGHVAIWRGSPRDVLAIAQKTLGMSANLSNEESILSGFNKLAELKAELLFYEDYDLETAAPAMASGDVYVGMGYSADLLACREAGLSVEYVYPEEGALIWMDAFVIPTASQNRSEAETFINFMLRPEIGGMITNYNHYATPNDASASFLDEAILNERAIFPKQKELMNAEILLPLSDDSHNLITQEWEVLFGADE